MKTIIAGSRSITNQVTVFWAIDNSPFCDKITEVVSGGARGIDTLGELWAARNAIPVTQFLPDWSVGKHAGLLRNSEMATYADALIAIHDGKSTGTLHMITQMKKLSKIVHIVTLREGVKL